MQSVQCPTQSAGHQMKKAHTQITEEHIQRTVKEFLEWDDWRSLRTEHAIERDKNGKVKRKVGELGMPDYLFIRYRPWEIDSAQVIWIEFKSPGEKPTQEQLKWHKAERDRGALVLVVDDIDAFVQWYKQSGLQRRKR